MSLTLFCPPYGATRASCGRLFTILLRNAQDAQEGVEAAQIGVTTRVVEGMAELLVTDCGPGFPPEIMARAFEPYVTSKAGGTGWGWPSSRRLSMSIRDTSG
ncbi:MAG: hypothetical protein IPN98_15420 [Propionivibrio sp.]|nr:hypothetical protein [Propionivibrio sp.]